MNKSKFLVGDVIKIIAGSHKGKIGPITKISKNKKWVSIQGINSLKHVKPSQTDSEGGIKEISSKLHLSNVALQDFKNKYSISKIGYQIKEGKKVRIAKKSNIPLKKVSK